MFSGGSKRCPKPGISGINPGMSGMLTTFNTLGNSPCERPLSAHYSQLFLVIPRLFLPRLTTLYCQDHGFWQFWQKRRNWRKEEQKRTERQLTTLITFNVGRTETGLKPRLNPPQRVPTHKAGAVLTTLTLTSLLTPGAGRALCATLSLSPKGNPDRTRLIVPLSSLRNPDRTRLVIPLSS